MNKYIDYNNNAFILTPRRVKPVKVIQAMDQKVQVVYRYLLYHAEKAHL